LWIRWATRSRPAPRSSTCAGRGGRRIPDDVTPAIRWLLTLPGVGLTLAVVIALEVGDVARLPRPRSWPAMRGPPTGPRERWEDPIRSIASGRQSVPEVGIRRSRECDLPHTPAHAAPPRQSSLRAARPAKGHVKAIGAVARHLAEATHWILSKGEGYREPKASAQRGSARGSAAPGNG
jgi:hypothetical protein